MIDVQVLRWLVVAAAALALFVVRKSPTCWRNGFEFAALVVVPSRKDDSFVWCNFPACLGRDSIAVAVAAAAAAVAFAVGSFP